ncbi:MAG: transglutaminase family protein [Verrucomicrobiae bacterium]|nr:transglutaminase family protein [Verrucomicrobiae bacterium]
MLFKIEHTTEYQYSEPATESFSELRLRPRDSLRQSVQRHATHVEPRVPVESYVDYFGNTVETVSVPFRHHKLVVTSECEVITSSFLDALSGLDLTVSEAVQLYKPRLRELYDFLKPSRYTSHAPEVIEAAAGLLGPQQNFAAAIKALNSHIFSTYRYKPGATNVSTTVAEFLEKREGVCQDFAHLMISICRCAQIPARYVSGYIETELPDTEDNYSDDTTERLIGATASHAWVEIYTPNHFWVGLDPTNNIFEGERHVQIGIGRDYADLPPLKGIFKGSNAQSLSVQVKVSRTGKNEVIED